MTLQPHRPIVADVERIERDPARILLGAFLDSLSSRNTRDAYEHDVEDYLAWCDAMHQEALAAKRPHIDAYVETLRQRGLAASTIARRISGLAGYFAYAVDVEILDRSPVERVRRPKVDDHTTSTGLTMDEFTRLVHAATGDPHGPPGRTLFLVLAYGLTGARVSELVEADVTDLDHERGHRVVRVVRKGGKRARLPLAPMVTTAMDPYLGGRDTGPLLATATGARMARQEVGVTVKRIQRRAGLERPSLHPHDFRHAFVTNSLDAGVALEVVQDAVGHADPRTTQRYNRQRNRLDNAPTYVLAARLAAIDDPEVAAPE